MGNLNFKKMHGLGNDFLIFDGENPLTPAQCQALANRRTGIGFDQILCVTPARSPEADLFMHIYNADGSLAGACGNGTRCVAWHVMEQKNLDQLVIETSAGLLPCDRAGTQKVRVDMGMAKLDWRDIPLSHAMDPQKIDVGLDLPSGFAVNMGNPHVVFFVDDVEKIDVAALGSKIEVMDLFPDRINVEFAQILSPTKIRMRVWERGAGITSACGSGACATLVAATRQNLSSAKVEIILDGGVLDIEYLPDGHVLMTGSVAHVFDGTITPEFLTTMKVAA